MKVIDLNKGYKYSSVLADNIYDVPQNLEDIDIPFDMYKYSVPDALEQGDILTKTFVFYKSLPIIKKYSQIYLYIAGVNGCAQVYLNGVKLDKIISTHPKLIDLSGNYIVNSKNILTLVLSSQMHNGFNQGLGIADNIQLHVAEEARYFPPNGLYAETESIGEKAKLKIFADLCNSKGENGQVAILTEIFNYKNKRVYKKLKKIKTGKESVKTVEIPVSLSRFYKWTGSDPYLYKVRVSLVTGDSAAGSESSESFFGIASVAMKNNKFTLCGEEIKLNGACIAPDNGIMGHISVYEYELRRALKLKECGFNAVRILGMPSAALLRALDQTGLLSIVDIFDKWEQDSLGANNFSADAAALTAASVRYLRAHPSVAAYCICNNAGETYLRGTGAALRDEIIQAAKCADPSRLITACFTELAPTFKEIDELGGRQKVNKENAAASALNLSREKDIFIDRIRKFAAPLSFAGYDNLHARYLTDKKFFPIVGLRTLPKKTADALDETEKYGIAGDFAYFGWDSPGDLIGCELKEGDLRPYCSDIGDMDITGQIKPQNFYRRVLSGNRNLSYIVSVNPEKEEGKNGYKNVSHSWNYPRFLGKPVPVEVYSGGDVVALYLDGKLIGRKLAGKLNRHKAVFNVAYYPGVLEAVSFFKGRECSRCTLESVQSPKALRLTSDKKTVGVGEYCFIEVTVVDKEGRQVPYAVREIEVKTTGEGMLYAVGNGDPMHNSKFGETRCPVYNGKALIALRTIAEGKISVKVESEGLLSYKMTLRAK